jgi:hypothetical protein
MGRDRAGHRRGPLDADVALVSNRLDEETIYVPVKHHLAEKLGISSTTLREGGGTCSTSGPPLPQRARRPAKLGDDYGVFFYPFSRFREYYAIVSG